MAREDSMGVLDPVFAAELVDISVDDLYHLTSVKPDNPSTLFDAVSIYIFDILDVLRRIREFQSARWVVRSWCEDVHATGVTVADAAYIPRLPSPHRRSSC